MDTFNPSTDQHLDPELLSSYHLGELPEAKAKQVKAHLLKCRECAELLFDFQELMEYETGSDPMHQDYEAGDSLEKVVPLGAGDNARKPLLPWRKSTQIAAMLAITIGAGTILLRQPPLPSTWLPSPTRGSVNSIKTVDLSQGAAKILLPISAQGPVDIHIFSSIGNPISTHFEVHPLPLDPKRLEVLIGDLSPGAYRIAVVKSGSDEKLTQVALAEFSFKVVD